VRLVIVLGAVNAIGPLSIDMYLPAFPDLARGLHTGASQVQLTLTACVAGLALGQLVVGPVSDRLGRRLPLIAAMTVYAVASLCCSIAPSAPVLMALRFVQGLAGAGGVVIARAVVRDLHTGAAAVRLFSSLMLVTGLAPILAPLAGGQVLTVTSWRGIFVVLAVLSALFAVLVAAGLRETLPPERRSDHGLRRTLQTMRALLRDRWFVGHALAGGLGFGALFAYISGSSFVLQGIYGVSPQLYSVLFAMNGLGLIAGSQVNARAVGRFGPARLLRGGLLTIAGSAGTLLAVVLAGGLGVWAVLVPMFVIVSSLSFVLPNSTALALADHAAVAGTASALLGVGQFLIGAAVAPLVGAGGTQSAVPMAAVMTGVALAALAARRAAGARRRLGR
jgi:MFS transporter, DHA1 family, multidrug resistance protein